MSAYGSDEVLRKTKELLRRLEPTQASIVVTSDHFLLHSCKGLTKELFDMWQKFFNLASSKDKLSFLYLANHIVQSEQRDEGRLKQLFKGVIGRAFEKAYRLCSDKDTRANLLRVISIWRDRNIYEKEFLDGIESVLRGVGTEPDAKGKKAAAPSGLLAAYQRLDIPKSLSSLGDNIRRYNEWNEKVELLKETLQTIIAQKGEGYSETETVCELAEYEQAIQQQKEYAQRIAEQLQGMLRAEDNQHLQEVLQIKNMIELGVKVQQIKDELCESEAKKEEEKKEAK